MGIYEIIDSITDDELEDIHQGILNKLKLIVIEGQRLARVEQRLEACEYAYQNNTDNKEDVFKANLSGEYPAVVT